MSSALSAFGLYAHTFAAISLSLNTQLAPSYWLAMLAQYGRRYSRLNISKVYNIWAASCEFVAQHNLVCHVRHEESCGIVQSSL